MHAHLHDCLATLAELLAPLPEVFFGFLRPMLQRSPIALQLSVMALQSGLPHLQLCLPVAQVNGLQSSCIRPMQSMCTLLVRLLKATWQSGPAASLAHQKHPE